ncbi:MAG TPA: Fe-S cluster assembly protein SufD [Planctomycetaceae bacterium]|nr:Fe-S cluster assembly protein SufD [Planctomycetaceae bacterium]
MTTTTAPAALFNRDAFHQLLAESPLPDWADQQRHSCMDQLETLALPNRRQEHWMRTDLRMFKPDMWGLRPISASEPPTGLLAARFPSSNDQSRDVQTMGQPDYAGHFKTINGHVVQNEIDPALADQGVLFGTAEDVLASSGDVLKNHWLQIIDSKNDYFAALHGAFHRGSMILYVPSGVRIAEPIHCLAAIDDGGVDTSHVLVVLGEDAEATVLTETATCGTTGSGTGFHCGGTEIVVGKNALLRMVNVQNWDRGVWHVARQKAVIHENAKLQWTLAALGSRLSQVAQDVALVGKNAEAQVNGVMFTEGKQQLVYNTLQHHEAPSCRSDLLYKGALQDRSRLVWRGMIKVDKAAQKTDGYQRNDNLMLSEAARSDSIPGLEIEADDVRCTHGATSGRVDEEQIFYAQARGLSADEAARLVVAGFFQQVFDRITIASVREALATAIGSRIRRVS